jgi:hypothetical protein
MREQLDRLRNKRTARGAYEETGPREGLYRSGGGRDASGAAMGAEDDAWDTRVGGRDEELYASGGGGADRGGYGGDEEQEIGLTPATGLGADTSYSSTGAGARGDYAGYDSVSAGKQKARDNPFGDEHVAPSLRSISPRPESSRGVAGHVKGQDSTASAGSDVSHKKSVFREGI